ncbi:hypothetical protein GPECTOR_75g733 [Gonium pectorale]|uniref:Uncharacterized protein n=1 Tax=Gonium pectorale TaxID=33097 RepID=A0A150G2A8_GONPE|nr:hypothetical protein GPECTOR_75g733 [Gonium pectorale]|eukprot:KXZ44009.1 hypothetical protein GPECTOR_75g733 [Gonium pectorale]
MATQQYSLAEEEAARRRYAAEVAAENHKMAREREIKKALEEQAKRQAPLQDAWYSRGDTHRRTEPLFSGNGVPAPMPASASSAAPPPQRPSTAFPWATTDNQVVVRPATAHPPSKLHEKQYPWSWNT